jgi:hypothetical protein
MTMTEKENNQQNIIEDLTVNEAEAEEVKGGIAHFSELAGIRTEIRTEEDVRPNPDVRTVYNPYITADYIERTPK